VTMRRLALVAITAAGFVLAPSAVLAQEKSISLDLIGNKEKDGKCTVFFSAANKLGIDIAGANFEVYLINVTGQALEAFNLKMPAIPLGKQRIMNFPLPYPCDQIAALFSNGFLTCQAGAEQTEQAELCNQGLRMSSKIGIKFGDDAT
jgi:hypothetical protein